jgi:kynurenine formamidase
MGRTSPGHYASSWTPPDYEVGDDEKIVGLVNERSPNNWGRWGADDERGTTNLLTPERVRAAAELIRTGRTVSMAVPLNSRGPVHPSRPGIQHWYGYSGSDMITGSRVNKQYAVWQGTDDFISMPLQGSTQWDALAHVGHEDSLYNGFWLGTVDSFSGARRCSIHRQRESLCGRGVLLDVARCKGVDRLAQGYVITPADLDEAVAAARTEVESGDILIIRTGHVAWWYSGDVDRDAFFADGEPGLGIACVEWLAAKDVAAVAVDNIGVEVEPFEPEAAQPLEVHSRLIRDLGMTLGEIWHLEDVSAACAEAERWAFFVAAQPLNVTNASGSPLNRIAIF